MPFRSQAQRGYLFAHHPEMAKRWAKETPKRKRLPARVNTHSQRQAMIHAMKGSR